MFGQGEIWWTDLPNPTGSGPGFRRPVIVVQGDALNQSRIATVVCIPLTSNLKWAHAPGNVFLPSSSTGLAKDSVANVSQIVSVDKDLLTERAGKVPRAKLELLWSGIDVIAEITPLARHGKEVSTGRTEEVFCGAGPWQTPQDIFKVVRSPSNEI